MIQLTLSTADVLNIRWVAGGVMVTLLLSEDSSTIADAVAVAGDKGCTW